MQEEKERKEQEIYIIFASFTTIRCPKNNGNMSAYGRAGSLMDIDCQTTGCEATGEELLSCKNYGKVSRHLLHHTNTSNLEAGRTKRPGRK